MANSQTNMETETNIQNASDPNYVLNQLSKLDKLDKIDKLETKINSFEDMLKESVNMQNSKIAMLELRNSQLQQSNFKLERAIDDLWKEVHGKNLILRGLEDNPQEDQNDLFKNVCLVIRAITKTDIEPDVVYRMGEYTTGLNRPVRIVLCKYRERNIIFDSRANLNKNYSIAADLPTDMRVDFAILFKKKEELDKQGEICKIDFKNREITTESGKGFASIHGILQPRDNTKTTNGSRRSFNAYPKNGRGPKRPFLQHNQNGSTPQDDPPNVGKYRKTDQSNGNDQSQPQNLRN